LDEKEKEQEDLQKRRFVISKSGSVNVSLNATQNEFGEIRDRLSQASYDLEVEKLKQSDFYTEAEMKVKFKKSTKKSKQLHVRKTRAILEELEMPEVAVSDHGSRDSGSTKVQRDTIRERTERMRRERNYEKAIEKAQEETQALFGGYSKGLVQKETKKKEEDEDEDYREEQRLFNELRRAKSLALGKTPMESLSTNGTSSQQYQSQPQQHSSLLSVVERVKQAALTQIINDNGTGESEGNDLILNATTEFIRTVQPLEEIPILKKSKPIHSSSKPSSIANLVNAPASQTSLETEPSHGPTMGPKRTFEDMRKSSIAEEEMIAVNADIEDHERTLRKYRQQHVQDPPPDPQGTLPKDHAKDMPADPKASITEMLSEPLVGDGMAATLQLLKQRGGTELDTVVGRKSDLKGEQILEKVKDPAPKLRLDYTDEFGRPLTQKEAFRKLSHKFHGKGPGKKKIEKQMKQLEEERRQKEMNATDTPRHALSAIQAEQERLQSPFIVLSRPSTILSKSDEPPTTLSKSSAVGTLKPSRGLSELEGGLKEGEFKEFRLSIGKGQAKK